MTVATFIAAATVVCIVFRMAIEACRRCGLEGLVLVAAGAFGLRVLAYQRIARRVVVELDVCPGEGGMTVHALGSHRVAVNVVGFVARKAVRRSIAMFVAGFMTLPALRLRMLAEQWEIGEFVIECIFVEMHDDGVPSLVVGMAAFAPGVADLGRQAMEARACAEIGGHVLVAIEAQGVLFRRLELRMAEIAVLLVFRMRLDDRAGHYERLDLRV